MQMLSQVVRGRFDLVDNARTSPVGASLCLAQVVNIVLVLESCGTVLLIFENLGQDSLGLCRVGVSVVLD